MFFKLAYQNVIKSVKDYTVYFMTLTFGVCLFYVFNSMESQQAILLLSESQKSIMKMTVNIIGAISIFISFILGFLIIYANQFLIKRRKKELGVYMVLGMEKGKISRILIAETSIIGIASLVAGLVAGAFAAQGMAVLTAKLFVVKMKEFKFIFSAAAMGKTILYFLIIYLVVMVFNTWSISRFKLIDLLMASRKNETLKVKKLGTSVILFLLSVISLGIAYYLILKTGIISVSPEFYMSLGLGIVGTLLFFLSLSGFALRIIKANKKVYYKGLNMFVLRQINAKITTTFVSMSFICLMLLVTIGVLSSGAGLTNTMTRQVKDGTPFDMSIIGTMESSISPDIAQISIVEQMKTEGIWNNKLTKNYAEAPVYFIPDLNYEQIMTNMNASKMLPKESIERIKKSSLTVMSISDYNGIMKLAGKDTIKLKKDQVALSASYSEVIDSYKEFVSSKNAAIEIEGTSYTVKDQLQTTAYYSAGMALDFGTLIVPDSVVKNQTISNRFLNIELATTNKDAIKELSQQYLEYGEKTGLFTNCITRIEAYEQGAGLTMMLCYIAVYIGIVFLITCSAILSLQQLSESSDNQERYELLRKIGTEDKEINRSIFKQVAISFLVPLSLAAIHSVVGLKVANQVISYVGYSNAMVGIIAASVGIVIIYGGYMMATYFGCKAMIKKRI
ncbi:MAG: FtsX-like permease family protein [Lachnospiraceae bacterium]|nr:FtsX-like permease family protein [Lachnospiraceae bacterium]